MRKPAGRLQEVCLPPCPPLPPRLPLPPQNPNAPPGTDPRHPGPLNPPDDKSSLNSPHGKLQPGPAGPGSDKGGGSGNENHQILKESHEVKNQVLLPGTYGGRQPNAPPPDSRFYLYNTPGQEAAAAAAGAGGARQRKESHSAPGSGGKPSLKDIKKETEDSKDQGVKPTMETQGPPPAPTSQQYAYIHAGYLPGPPYNAYEPSHPGNPHPMYRGGLGGHLPEGGVDTRGPWLEGLLLEEGVEGDLIARSCNSWILCVEAV
ncbi:collagen alpha-1(III) chain-like [Diaphorina citri]|uniref:Collagen alpha-1(III) chain-like n=1 Tax=Diaphorina citri TaxID=121845 RepID=A0A3Q0J1L4_DIACI|nr:collagen alpha-1(III) chain-like [Diaphorina citri]